MAHAAYFKILKATRLCTMLFEPGFNIVVTLSIILPMNFTYQILWNLTLFINASNTTGSHFKDDIRRINQTACQNEKKQSDGKQREKKTALEIE